MAKIELKAKVRQALRTGHFGDDDDLVDVSDGEDGTVHVVVVSRKFDGKLPKKRRDLIWDDLMENLSKQEWGQVSLAIARSPEDIKSSL